ncbi:signal peptidase I [soil metagenome]
MCGPGNNREPGPIKALVEFIVILAIAFALVFGFVRPVVAEPFKIPSESMVPTLEIGDRVLANKVAYDLSNVKRGDILIFRSPVDGAVLIKRAVGLPGDTLEIRAGKLYLNNKVKDEPYINVDARFAQPFGPVPAGNFFAMGDNRMNSTDSRSYGPVPQENLVGEAEVRFWPPWRLSLL